MGSVVKKTVHVHRLHSSQIVEDSILVEEPLEVYLDQDKDPLIVTMRTPDRDQFLCLGLLFSMSILSPNEPYSFIKDGAPNRVRIQLPYDVTAKKSTFLQASSCGLCNRASWEDINNHSLYPIYSREIQVTQGLIFNCEALISKNAGYFHETGGSHRVTLIDFEGEISVEAEDVGRHNAFDKVIGQCIKEKKLPLSHSIVILSGRCSYEMCQKAWMAGIPIIVALGPPSSKAIELAQNAGVTLVGFAKSESFNIYTHDHRIKHE